MRAPLLLSLLLASTPALADPPAAPTPASPAPAAPTPVAPAPTSGAAPAPPPTPPTGAAPVPAPAAPVVDGAATSTSGVAAGTTQPKPRKRAAKAPVEEEEEAADEQEVVPHAAVTPPTANPPVEAWKPRARIAGWVLLGAAGALLVSGVATFGAEGYYVAQWNDDARCLANGRYRVTTCHDEYDKATRTETLAVELTLAGGIAGVTAAVLLLASRPPAPKKARRAVSCGPGPGSVGLACAGTF